VYSMPNSFGQVRRCAISQDPDSFRRNLNLHVISQAPNLSLIQTPGTTKDNLRTWINRYKMINDTIDILDVKIVNIGVEFKILSDIASGGSQHSLLRRCATQLMLNLFYRHLEVGEPLNLSSIYTTLNAIPGVVDTVDVRIVNKTGGLYSDVSLNINQYLSSDGRKVYLPENYIFELKYPEKDILGVVE